MAGLLQSYEVNRRRKMHTCLFASILASILSSQLSKDSAFFQVFKTKFLFLLISLFCELQ